jgi:trimeric autotransporter adhesin
MTPTQQRSSYQKRMAWPTLWLLLSVFLLQVTPNRLYAQVGTPTYFNVVPPASGSANAFPLNSTSNTKIQWIYGPGVFSSAGAGAGTPCPAGQLITKIYIRFATANPTFTYTDFSISLGQTVGTDVNYGTASNTSYPFYTGLTNVFFQPTFQLTGNAAQSWYGIDLQTPFAYDPSLSLLVEVKALQTASGGNGVVNVSTTGQMQRLYGPYVNTTGTSNTGSTPVGFDVIAGGPCSDPPTAGTATASPAGTICPGQSSTLNLTGTSTGTGQTYQWESSLTSGGPYTDIGPSSGFSNLNVSPTVPTYYRCKVTCGSSTVPSTEVMVNVSTPFPGGSYTIDNSQPTGGTNFNSFTDAVAAISCGISGPVIFDVDPSSGPYTEQITLPATIGSTAINTVTFNGNGRTLQFNSTDGNNRHVVKFDGADYITFNDLVINCTTGTFGWGMHFTNGADYNTVSLCTINSQQNSTSTNYTAVAMSGSVTSATTAGNSGNYNTFIDNTFNGGYYGATVCGAGVGSEVVGNTFTNCAIRNFYNYGIYTLNCKDAIISTCDFSRPAPNSIVRQQLRVFMTTGTTRYPCRELSYS